MKKNILILWLGAFGYAVACYLGKNNPQLHFYAAEKNSEIRESLQDTRKHPYFFKNIPDNTLPENIQLIENIEEIIPEIDIIISIIPCQFVADAFSEMKNSLKPWVVIFNLAKGIDNNSLEVMSEKLSDTLESQNYIYAYLAGGMIAEEVMTEQILGADIITEDWEVWVYLKELFHSESLDIHLKIWNPKNTELAAALKNIIALILWYYEWQWTWASTLGYYFSVLLREITWVMGLLGSKETPDFSNYALSWDLIATCFGNSRNRLLGNMLGEWIHIQEALAELKAQKKIAEGYESLKGIKKLITWKQGFEEIEKFCEKFL